MKLLGARTASWPRLDARGACRSVVISLGLLAWSAGALAERPTPIDASGASLVARARELGLAGSLAWRRLLHYRRASGGERSEIDNAEFFLAPTGARDPEAELEATLLAFQRPIAAGRQDAHALCRFPARRRLLSERLRFQGWMDTRACPALTNFLTELDAESVALVYAANYLENPASAFGHTFLRLRKRSRVKAEPSGDFDDERDHGVEYTANVDTANPVLYAFKGLTGMFEGVYRFDSFAAKLRGYANAEARDVWEYGLDLESSEVQLLTLHLWELSIATLDYYYLSKNCSYHALATVEAVVPRIDVISRLPLVVIPRDTVKALFTARGLVRDAVYRPSLRSQFRVQVSRLNPTQKATVQALTLDPHARLPPGLTLEERVTTLDVAKLVLEARFSHSLELSDGARPDPRVQVARRILARRRAALSTTLPAPSPGPAPADKAPHLAHGSMRVTFGTGVTSQYGSALYTLGYRLALHDFSDPPDGEPELSQVQFLDTRLRYDLEERKLTLDRLTFAELVALTPMTQYEHTWSWRGRAFGMRLNDAACRDCFAHGMEIGIGATAATPDERFAVFVMADGYFAISDELDGIGGSFLRLGIGPYAGIRVRLFGNAIGVLTANWAYLPWQSLRATYDIRANFKSTVGKDVALGLEGAAQPESVELLLASYLYF